LESTAIAQRRYISIIQTALDAYHHDQGLARVLAYFSAGINSPVFDDNEVQMMRNSLNDLLQQHVLPVDWNIRNIPDHQLLTLHILSSLSRLINDPDTDLFQNLINGVPTGFKQDIHPSHCFATVDRDENAMHEPLSVHMSSWKSAHDDEAVHDELIQIELDRGWLEPYPGTLTDFRTNLLRYFNWKAGGDYITFSTTQVGGGQYGLWIEQKLCHS
jgi:hypothetical protein